jgi:Fic family protein
MNDKPFNELPLLPPNTEFESKKILKQAIKASRELARLKGYCSLLPNDSILLSSIILKEATASSEIENIITTQDELYKALISKKAKTDPQTKEVLNYRAAVWIGYNEIKEREILSINTILKIQAELEGNNAGIRKVPGTSLMNDATGEIIYTPPSNEAIINKLLANLEKFINIEDETDYLIKMAIIHYQFESIHPFYDGNGRTGRIINVLYLVQNRLLDSPILYLSSYIIKNKSQYYKLLQEVRTKDNWEEWILYILKAVELTAKDTLSIIESIILLMNNSMNICREKLPKTIYSKELVELVFMQPYTKISYLVDAGIGERRTASKYLKALEEIGILESFKLKKEIIYVNKKLYELLKK